MEPVSGDKDVFDDGTVVMLNTPGHTPGHHALLVKLKEKGYVLLSGDLAHFRENYDTNGVPMFNTDHTYTLGSLDRFKKIAANLKATRAVVGSSAGRMSRPSDIERPMIYRRRFSSLNTSVSACSSSMTLLARARSKATRRSPTLSRARSSR